MHHFGFADFIYKHNDSKIYDEIRLERHKCRRVTAGAILAFEVLPQTLNSFFDIFTVGNRVTSFAALNLMLGFVFFNDTFAATFALLLGLKLTKWAEFAMGVYFFMVAGIIIQFWVFFYLEQKALV